MKLEVGKFYRTLSGLKVGPICLYDGGPHYDINTGGPCGGILWDESGAVVCGTPTEDQHPIVAEWSDEPIFKAGDRVRVATTEWGAEQHGCVGTVEEIDEDDSLPVSVLLDGKHDDGPYCYRHDQLETAPQQPDPVEPILAPVRLDPPSFNPGDLIRSNSDSCDDIAPGDTFTALLIEGGGEAPWLVTFNHPTSGSRTRFADRYERAEQA